MISIYVSLIIKGKRTISDVPDRIRDEVRAALREAGYDELAED